jgi:cytosine/uracil/thiamine/allantoin permease
MPDLARDTKHLLKIKSAAMRGFFVLMFVVALCLTLPCSVIQHADLLNCLILLIFSHCRLLNQWDP